MFSHAQRVSEEKYNTMSKSVRMITIDILPFKIATGQNQWGQRVDGSSIKQAEWEKERDEVNNGQVAPVTSRPKTESGRTGLFFCQSFPACLPRGSTKTNTLYSFPFLSLGH